jgi:hypothetical protein
MPFLLYLFVFVRRFKDRTLMGKLAMPASQPVTEILICCDIPRRCNKKTPKYLLFYEVKFLSILWYKKSVSIQWPRGLSRGFVTAPLLGLWVRIPPRT